MIIRGLSAVAFVWLLMPDTPDVGPGPNGVGSPVSLAAPVENCGPVHSWLLGEIISEKSIGAVGILTALREDLLERMQSVRADLRTHEVRGGGFKDKLRGAIFS